MKELEVQAEYHLHIVDSLQILFMRLGATFRVSSQVAAQNGSDFSHSRRYSPRPSLQDASYASQKEVSR